MSDHSYIFVVDLDSSKVSQPQNAVYSLFEQATRNEDIEYESISVSKEDMLNEYTDSVMTTATVRVDIENLKHSIDNFSVWLDKKINMETDEGVFGVEVNPV